MIKLKKESVGAQAKAENFPKVYIFLAQPIVDTISSSIYMQSQPDVTT